MLIMKQLSGRLRENIRILDLGLQGAGINKDDTLDIQVTVTMPIPDGIDAAKLAILHFN